MEHVATSYPLHKITVVLLENVHPRARELFEGAGYTVRTVSESLQGDALIEAAGDAHLLGIRSRSKLPARYFEKAERLWAVGCFCIGVDQVDQQAAAERGVAVFNAPFSNTRSVAELTIGEIIALHRRLADRSSEMRRGLWRKTAEGCNEVRGRTLGIIGYGRIGSQVSVLAEAIGMRVLYNDVAECLPLGNATAVRSLDSLLEKSDVVSIHVPQSGATRGLIGPRELSLMKQGAFLINNARGDVVDQEALARMIRSGRIAGAAVDVFPQEPGSEEEPFESPLRGLNNVILTPHIAGSTLQAQRNIAEEVTSKLIKFMNNGSTTTAVNVPEVELPVLHPDKHRILHFHRNVPGVLSKMHKIIADLGVNIVAEYLQTDPRHSYVILDIDPTHGDELVDQLRSVDETIRVRTLW
ncbi:MAG: phosphoglycerate dehydrogenase [Phycisphaeraceae bacterium]|nr:MAG: phosphoglycerate dehydrogenase [Phycisphaeraceae bacterium]